MKTESAAASGQPEVFLTSTIDRGAESQTSIWSHLVNHHDAAQAFCGTSNGDGLVSGERKRGASWPVCGNVVSLDQGPVVVEREGKAWIELGFSRTYIPSLDDFGFSLRLESVARDSQTGVLLSPVNVIVTDPVIISPSPRPRYMISVGCLNKSRNLSFESQSFNGDAFSVLSYNILADLYASRNVYNYCPAWALTWEYRRKQLLDEIIGYNADILCLQELEFDKIALPLVEAMEPYQRSEGRFRLMKDNIALVAILEEVETGTVHATLKSRICVSADTVILLTLRPTLIYMPIQAFQMQNSFSDPHRFVLAGKVTPVHNKSTDPLGIYKHLKLYHSMCLASAYTSLFQLRRDEEHQQKKMDQETREPQFTNLRAGFSGTLDYIFYTEHRLKVEGLLELLDYESLGGAALPSPIWSSDHIALMASFKFKPGFWKRQYSSPPPNPWR
ncbi:hypothetical protein RJ640_006626 [Escallonia rubra]|uniref:Endonuclease/exonuclease/phosphatase domain-containing protein n=1 Tax=Escallonia rubra TaxID=112253 RepID=A0AA88UK95_9ASTE|nr:hypothetical protein RJ640_006626 [Escallonia rubra]